MHCELDHKSVKISVISKKSPGNDNVNEDAWFIVEKGAVIYLGVIDGASQRVPTDKLKLLFAKFGNKATAAAYAARFTKVFIENEINNNEIVSLSKLMLKANKNLGSEIDLAFRRVYADGLFSEEPGFSFIRQDPRLIRLALPVCVATIVELNIKKNSLKFAHIGDTELTIFNDDDDLMCLTENQMGKHDEKVIRLARQLQKVRHANHLSDVLNAPEIISKNKYLAVYHNYIDESGRPDRNLGVGVINGLPQMEYYIQTGSLSLDSVSEFLLCTDGFPRPPQWDETQITEKRRYLWMRNIIKKQGLKIYLRRLRAIELKDETRDKYPRLKVHDDATAIWGVMKNE